MAIQSGQNLEDLVDQKVSEQRRNCISIAAIIFGLVGVIVAAILSWFQDPIGKFIMDHCLQTQTPYVITATAPQSGSNSATPSPIPPFVSAEAVTVTPTQPSLMPERITLPTYTGAGTHVPFDVSLNDGEAIVGSGWGFDWGPDESDKTEGSCVAFIIRGSGTFHFMVIDGVLEK